MSVPSVEAHGRVADLLRRRVWELDLRMLPDSGATFAGPNDAYDGRLASPSARRGTDGGARPHVA